jgi:dephospho-CoA kinase
MLIVGLTGGIGSGKTEVACFFSQLGAPTIDADSVARTLCNPGQLAFQKIYERFGEGIIKANGELDRKKLREIVFEKEAEKIWLEKILHPFIIQAILDWSKNINFSYGMVIAPLLLETEMKRYVNRVLVVDCSVETQIERVVARDGIKAATVELILAQQMPRAERLALADDVILNEGRIEDLKIKVAQLHAFYQTLEHKVD